MTPQLLFAIIFGLCAIACILFIYWHIQSRRLGTQSIKQFETDLEVFNATGLKRISVLDIEINEDIRKKAKVLKKEANQSRDTQLYIIECMNANICPVCGENIEEVRCPRKPGCWDILKKCTECTWQLILADLSYD